MRAKLFTLKPKDRFALHGAVYTIQCYVKKHILRSSDDPKLHCICIDTHEKTKQFTHNFDVELLTAMVNNNLLEE